MFELFHTFKLFIADLCVVVLSSVLFTRHSMFFTSFTFRRTSLLETNQVSVFFVILFMFSPKKLASSAYTKQQMFYTLNFFFFWFSPGFLVAL